MISWGLSDCIFFSHVPLLAEKAALWRSQTRIAVRTHLTVNTGWRTFPSKTSVTANAYLWIQIQLFLFESEWLTNTNICIRNSVTFEYFSSYSKFLHVRIHIVVLKSHAFSNTSICIRSARVLNTSRTIRKSRSFKNNHLYSNVIHFRMRTVVIKNPDF